MLILTKHSEPRNYRNYNFRRVSSRCKGRVWPHKRTWIQHRSRIVGNTFDYVHRHNYWSRDNDDPYVECNVYRCDNDGHEVVDRFHIASKQSIQYEHFRSPQFHCPFHHYHRYHYHCQDSCPPCTYRRNPNDSQAMELFQDLRRPPSNVTWSGGKRWYWRVRHVQEPIN